MLKAKATKNAAGIVLGGDYFDLVSCHELIHKFAADGGPIHRQQKEFILALAYDLRKAYERSRNIETVEIYERNAEYYSVEILWPIFLTQLAILRSAAARIPTSKHDQSILFALEHCAEEALQDIDPPTALKGMDWLAHFSPLPESFLLEFVSVQAKNFVTLGRTKKSRMKMLSTILGDINPLSASYREFAAYMFGRAKKNQCSPHDLHDLSEWPEFKW